MVKATEAKSNNAELVRRNYSLEATVNKLQAECDQLRREKAGLLSQVENAEVSKVEMEHSLDCAAKEIDALQQSMANHEVRLESSRNLVQLLHNARATAEAEVTDIAADLQYALQEANALKWTLRAEGVALPSSL
ncbi:hypothetical protein LTR08_002437 [Meristemomyces frigidus]|nr:hypothetical protein LTR08_002437 [Meristemomyces frigidus]